MAFDYATASLEKASTVILGIPYDRSSSYIPGCRFAPAQIRIGAGNIETYSPYFDKDTIDLLVHDAGDLVLSFESVKHSFSQIQQAISRFVKNKKQLIVMGGEHTITVPIVTELIKYYPNLQLIQFDAHSDTRDEYRGDKYSHATVIRRISEFLPDKNIFQLGLRSLTGPKHKKNQFLFSVEKHIALVKKQIGNKPCYFTLDVDVIDCGLLPAVQTAEPNGITYRELFASIKKMAGLNFIGCDIVEYNPLADSNLAYASVVAEIVRELTLLLNQNKLKKI